ncbi:hypothetical protein GQ54DRAFT_257379 [Martensiomyces pterosporus]|nr:hypothetical protein GQ54DRAFT_257379 [Martensiomyces pterosporus]
MIKFENSFWDNPGLGQQPRYERGPQRLYEKLEQGSYECDELLSLLRDRVAIEEMYANSLRQLAERKFSTKGFGRDEGATLKTAYHGLVSECLALAEAHSDLAIELTSSVVMPLRNFSSEHRARVRASWKIIDDTIRRSSTELSQVDRNHRVYTQKAAAAEQMRLKESPGSLQPGASAAEFEVKSRPSMNLPTAEAAAVAASEGNTAADRAAAGSEDDLRQQRQILSGSDIGVLHSPVPPVQGELDVASIVLGNVALTRHEFHVMLQRMQTEVPQHDVKFGILGTFRSLISGESLAGWWCTNYPTVVRNEADAISVGQSMMNQGYLRFMGRGSQFQSRPNAYYQWKKPALDFQSDDDYDSDDEPLGNRSAHLGKVMTYERAQREADEASQIYRDSVVRAELVRTDLEEQLTNYLDTMEVWELNRLMNIKSTLSGYARVNKLPVQAELAIGDRLEVYEESVKPHQDIQWAIEHYGTGRFTPRPIIFRPFSLSPAEYQIFGVPLEEQLLVSHKDTPMFPAKALSLIRKSSREMAPEDKYKVWTTRALLRNIHELRNAVNRGSKVTLKQLRAFDLPVVANALVLYFLELPQPLCPDELYDPLRALYSSRSEKDSVDTMQAIRHLLQGVNYAHLRTMQDLFGTLSEQIKDDDSEARTEFLKCVSQRLGPVVMRAKEIVGVSLNRMPENFVTDLIENYDVILAGIETSRPFKPTARPVKSEAGDHATGALASGLSNAHISIPAGPSSLAQGASAGASLLAAGAASGSGPTPARSPRTSLEKSASASKRSSLLADGTAERSTGAAEKRASTASADKRSSMLSAGDGEAQKPHRSFDDDEVSVGSILEDANEPSATADNMDFFLKDEDSDGTDDEDGDDIE